MLSPAFDGGGDREPTRGTYMGWLMSAAGEGERRAVCDANIAEFTAPNWAVPGIGEPTDTSWGGP